MYKAPQSHLPIFMALIIPNMRINMCYFVDVRTVHSYGNTVFIFTAVESTNTY
jgi:hypothetical protein